MLHIPDVSTEAFLSIFEVFLPKHFWPKVLYVLVSLQCKMTKNGEKMNLQVGGPTNTIVLTENRTGVTLIMDLTLYQLGHASTT